MTENQAETGDTQEEGQTVGESPVTELDENGKPIQPLRAGTVLQAGDEIHPEETETR